MLSADRQVGCGFRRAPGHTSRPFQLTAGLVMISCAPNHFRHLAGSPSCLVRWWPRSRAAWRARAGRSALQAAASFEMAGGRQASRGALQGHRHVMARRTSCFKFSWHASPRFHEKGAHILRAGMSVQMLSIRMPGSTTAQVTGCTLAGSYMQRAALEACNPKLPSGGGGISWPRSSPSQRSRLSGGFT